MPDFSDCGCVCEKVCDEGLILDPTNCTCRPELNCDLVPTNESYDPLQCEPDAPESNMGIIGCNWYLQDNTDFNPFPYDPRAQKRGELYGRAPKVIGGDACQYEDETERMLIKNDVPNGNNFPGVSLFKYFKTPYHSSTRKVYWIRTLDRVDPTFGCPERSWLSWSDNDCNSNGDDAPIRLVDQPEAKMWEFVKKIEPT